MALAGMAILVVLALVAWHASGFAGELARKVLGFLFGIST